MYGSSNVATGTGITALAYTGMQAGHWLLAGVMLIYIGWLLGRFVKRSRRGGDHQP